MKQASKLITILIALLAVLITVQAALAEELSINGVTLNGIALEANGNSPELKPLNSLQLGFTVTNNYTIPTTIFSTQLLISLSGQPDVTFSDNTPFNLLVGQSKTKALTSEVPLEFTTGDYPARLKIKSLNDENVPAELEFPFVLRIKQSPQDILLQAPADLNLNCANTLSVRVNITNRGSVSQTFNTNGVTLFLENSNFKASQKFELDSNTRKEIILSIPVENLTPSNNDFTLKATYWFDQYTTASFPVVVTKNSCLQNYTPNSNGLTISEDQIQVFGANAFEDTEFNWYIDDVLQLNHENTFTFKPSEVGTYNLKVIAGNHPGDSHSWQITVSNVYFSGSFQTNVPDNATLQQLANFQNFQVENSKGKITFNQPVDLRAITNLDALFTILDNIVSVNSQSAGAFNKPATVTLNKEFANYTILKSEVFNGNSFIFCPNTVCRVVSNSNGLFVFTVTGFSTYKVMEIVPPQLEVSAINFELVNRNVELSNTVTIKNIGSSESLTGLEAELVGVDVKYLTQLNNSLPAALAPGDSATLTLKLTLPEDEAAGRHSIGALKISSDQDTKNVNIYVNPKSYLTVTKLEVNGKTSGDLNPEGDNTIEVEVENEYTEEIEDITVTAKLLDVDGDDLEEESDSFDLDVGDDDTVTLTFDLSSEKLDEENYVLEITVEGKATDNSEQITILSKILDVDREKHRILIKSLDLGSSVLECLRQTSLRVKVENVGKNNENEVEIRVSNTQLELDQKKSNIGLDKYSGNDANYEASFSLNLEDTSAGTYPFSIEVYRDGDLEDSDEVTLEVKDCSQTKTQRVDTLSNEELAKQLEEQVKQQVQARRTSAPTTTVKTTDFRETQAYMNMLMVLVILLVLAIILGLIAAGRRER